MMIDTENKLLAIDESCLSELSQENESTISGGTFGLISGILGLVFGGWYKPSPAPAPGTGYTIVNNNYNTIYVNAPSGASSGSSSGASAGASTGGTKPGY